MPLQETPTDGPNNSAAPAAAAAAPAPAQAPAMPAPAPAPAAASIPNLLDRLRPAAGTRGSSRRGGLRGGGRARAPIPPGYDMPPGHNMHPPWSRTMPAASSHSSHSGGRPLTVSQRTSNIQGTDTDAALSRLSAVGVGLLDDRFAQYFAGEDGEPAPRRLPIINRGTYIRTMALDKMIEAVLAAGGDSPRQIVSLGAGTDTRALRMLTRQKQPAIPVAGSPLPPYKNVIYHEIDFPRTSDRKRAIVEAVPAIRALLDGPVTQHAAATTTATSWSVGLGNNNVLYSHGLDLRELNEGFTEVLPGYQSHVPTLVVSECCLCYLLPEEAQSVLGYFVKAAAAAEAAQPSTSTGIGIILYEPIHLNDSFGRTMVTNLAARGIEMPTLAAWPDGPSQTARLAQQLSGGGGGGDGDAQADHRTIDQIWDTWVPEAEKARVNALEGLDEEEEWKLLASHYVVAWGHRGDFFRTVWKHLEAVPEVTEE